jgi:signal transduction histidine kinase
MHGGQIWVKSEGKDKGSIFTFSVPIREANQEAGTMSIAVKNI